MSNDLTLPFTGTSDTDQYAFQITVTGGGTAIIANGYGTAQRGTETGIGVYGETDVGAGVEGHSTTSGTGVVGISTGSGAGVIGQSTSNNGVAGTSDSGAGIRGVSNSGVGVMGQSTSNWGVGGTSDSGAGVMGQSTSNNGVAGTSTSGNGVSAFSQHGTGLWAKGTPAGYFEGNVIVTGDITLTNADCAEEFDVTATEAVEPGMVMVFDQHGALQPSQQMYDKKVAGVISGAGDYRPGLILDKKESSEGRMPIALVGKVYCKVDAKYASIEVGDLLTTSPTPGHAMRAVDPLRAFGAVIGKALQPLDDGRGLIPILVALQ